MILNIAEVTSSWSSRSLLRMADNSSWVRGIFGQSCTIMYIQQSIYVVTYIPYFAPSTFRTIFHIPRWFLDSSISPYVSRYLCTLFASRNVAKEATLTTTCYKDHFYSQFKVAISSDSRQGHLYLLPHFKLIIIEAIFESLRAILEEREANEIIAIPPAISLQFVIVCQCELDMTSGCLCNYHFMQEKALVAIVLDPDRNTFESMVNTY